MSQQINEDISIGNSPCVCSTNSFSSVHSLPAEGSGRWVSHQPLSSSPLLLLFYNLHVCPSPHNGSWKRPILPSLCLFCSVSKLYCSGLTSALDSAPISTYMKLSPMTGLSSPASADAYVPINKAIFLRK